MNVQMYLEKHHVPFDVIPHKPTHDARRLAEVTNVDGNAVAKTVLLKAGRGFVDVVAVLPATCRVNLAKAAHALGDDVVVLATERDIVSHCPDCEAGVLPPFGSQYAMKTLVDARLTHEDEIVFEGNHHDKAIRLRYEDYRRVENPIVGEFAEDG